MLPLLVAGRAKLMIISLRKELEVSANQDGVVLQVLMEWKAEACSWLKTTCTSMLSAGHVGMWQSKLL